MTKLERMIRNYGKEYTLTTNTLKRYFDDNLIDSLVCFSEISYNKTIYATIENHTLKVWSYETNCPCGYCDIEDEHLLNVLKEAERY